MSEHKNDSEAQAKLTEQFTKIMDDYVQSYLPNAMFDGEKSNMYFDESNDGWYGVNTEENTGGADGVPVAYRLVEKPGKIPVRPAGS